MASHDAIVNGADIAIRLSFLVLKSMRLSVHDLTLHAPREVAILATGIA